MKENHKLAKELIKIAKDLVAGDKFFKAYVEAALWSSTDDDDEPMDKNYDMRDIAPEALRKMEADCKKFQRENEAAINEAAEQGYNDEQAGHDFWLTRNGHGAGFWDRNLGDVGERLTKACDKFGEQYLYVGDDGKIYV